MESGHGGSQPRHENENPPPKPVRMNEHVSKTSSGEGKLSCRRPGPNATQTAPGSRRPAAAIPAAGSGGTRPREQRPGRCRAPRPKSLRGHKRRNGDFTQKPGSASSATGPEEWVRGPRCAKHTGHCCGRWPQRHRWSLITSKPRKTQRERHHLTATCTLPERPRHTARTRLSGGKAGRGHDPPRPRGTWTLPSDTG